MDKLKPTKREQDTKKRLFLKTVSLFTLFAFLACQPGCMYYYKVNQVDNYSEEKIDSFEQQGKYFILHQGEQAWHLYDFTISNDTISGKITSQLDYHVNYLNPKYKRNSYKKKEAPNVIKEVHLFTSDSSFSSFDTQINIPFSSIKEIKVYDPAKGYTFLSWFIPPVIGILGGVLIIAVWTLDGGLFGKGW